jgi:superfamily I DNA/RNA helicase
VDGNEEDRSGTISVFNGARPIVDVFGSASEESQRVSNWLRELKDADVKQQEIGIFVRSGDEISRAKDIVDLAGLESRVLDDKAAVKPGCVTISTMHLAKGLEFRYVAVVACDDEVIPSQARIEEITDQADLEEVYNTERHLLYVACTRARDGLIVTGVDPESEFLNDLV